MPPTPQDTQLHAAPSRQALAAPNRSGRLRVSGRLRTALDEMVWTGLKRPDAAKAAGMTDHGLREALRRPHVKAYYIAQLEVLRTSERARNIHALAGVRDGSGNGLAVVGAVKALEQMADAPDAAVAQRMQPGLQIVVIQPAQQISNQAQTAVNPLIELQSVPVAEAERDE